ncbi:MAG: hypothetical protein PUP90_30205 [Nostoc sp. S4]|nr:hypothetical protein [Nostoc sp. S4]
MNSQSWGFIIYEQKYETHTSRMKVRCQTVLNLATCAAIEKVFAIPTLEVVIARSIVETMVAVSTKKATGSNTAYSMSAKPKSPVPELST